MPVEKRVDPEDGAAYTYEELAAYYKGKYKKAAVEAYWETCKPVKTKGKGKGKAKAEPKAKGKAKAKAKGKAEAKAKVKAKAKAKVVNYAVLVKGTKLQAKSSDGKWYPAQVVALKKGKDEAKPVKINWVGYTSASDEWMDASTLRSKLLQEEADKGADTHVTIVPYFTVPDGKMEEFKAGFKDFYKYTKRGTSECIYYNFAVSGNVVHCREGYKSGAGALAHLGDVKAQLDAAVAMSAKVDLHLMGPGKELKKCKEAFEPLGTTFWATDKGGMWFGGRQKRGQDTHVTLCPTFTVPDDKLKEFKKGFEGFYKATKKGTKSCLYYNFASEGNRVFCREGYKDAEGVLAHLGDVKEAFEKAAGLAGEGGLKISCMGPAAELEKLKEALTPFGTEFWSLDEGGFWFGVRNAEKAPRPDTQVTLCPHFTVPDGKMDEFKAGFPDFYAGTKKGTKSCLYYGFSICGNTVFCRESYKNAGGVLAHLGDVKASLDKAVGIVGEGGLDLSVMGPKKELEKLTEALTPLGCKFWESEAGSMWFGKKGAGKQDSHLTLCPSFNVPEGKLEDFKATMPDFTAATKAGTRECLYWGFCSNGNKVFCREGYKTAEGILAHLGDVKDEFAKVAAFVEKLEVHGPADELSKLKDALTPLGAKFYELDSGSFWK